MGQARTVAFGVLAVTPAVILGDQPQIDVPSGCRQNPERRTPSRDACAIDIPLTAQRIIDITTFARGIAYQPDAGVVLGQRHVDHVGYVQARCAVRRR